MVDEYRPAVLRGFDIAVADIGDQLHLCHPLLSFEGDPTLYVARRLNWQNDRKALVAADPSEASDLGTLLPDTHGQAIASGETVVAVGAGFVQAATAAGVQLDGSEMAFVRVHDAECRISIATPASSAKLKTRLTDEARTAFDEELGDAARGGHRLSDRGNAALLLLRRCGPRRRDDLAIRQLAGARQNREFDLYRRLLMRFSFELDTQENDLDEKAERHVALVAGALRYTTLDLSPGQKYPQRNDLDEKAERHVALVAGALRYTTLDLSPGQKYPQRNDLDEKAERHVALVAGALRYTTLDLSLGQKYTQRNDLDKKVEGHIALVAGALRHTTLDLSPGQKYRVLSILPAGGVMPYQRLPVSGGIMTGRHIYRRPNAEFSPPVGGSKSPAVVCLHSDDFGESVQRDPQGERLMFAQSKKHSSGPFLFTSKPRNQVLTERSKMIPTGEASAHLHNLTLPISDKGVVDTVGPREAA